jgi:ATP-dependent DNA helicase RecQ
MADVRTQRFFIDKIGEGNGELSAERIASLQRRAGRQLNAMVNYAQWERCRRRQILEYFGEDKLPENCRCDVCAAQRPALKLSGRAAALESERAQVASASPRAASRKPARPSAQSTPAPSAEARTPFWQKDMTRAESRKPEEQTTRAKVAASQKVAGGKVGAMYGSAVEQRFERLRTLRLELARARGWRAFQVLHDATLLEIARSCPRNLRELMEIKGIGKQKAEEFGQALLAELGEH